MSEPTRGDQTIGSIMQRGVLILARTTTVKLARQRALPGQILVLLDEANRPMGILPEERLAYLAEQRSLFSYPEHLFPVTWTREDAFVGDVLAGLWQNPYVRWHVVMLGAEVRGVVSPNMLLEECRRRALARLMNPLRPFSEADPPGPFGIVRETPPNACYVCYQQYPPHRVKEYIWDSGQAFCPKHLTPIDEYEHSCTGQTD